VKRSISVATAAIVLFAGVTVPAQAALADTGPALSGTYENTSPLISYTGSWATTAGSRDSGGDNATGKVGGDSAEFTFAGTGVDWIGRTAPYLGLADVYLDGVLVTVADSYSATAEYQRPIFSRQGLPEGQHTIRVVRQGKHSALSKGNDIVLDAFTVTDATAPAAVTGVATAAAETGVTVSWTASPESDVRGYRVYRAAGKTAAVMIADGTTALSVVDATAPVGTPLTYSVVAFDASGNASTAVAAAPVTVSVGVVVPAGSYDNASDAITYSGTWATNTHSRDTEGTSTQAKTAGAYARMAFVGDHVEILGRTGTYFGIADVYIDDVKVGSADFYSPTTTYQKAVFVADDLRDGSHKLRIVRSGTRNAKSTGNDIVLDSVVVKDSIAPSPLTGVRAAAAEASIGVTWRPAAEPDIDAYRVYRSVDGSPAVKVADVAVGETTFTDVTAPAAKPITYSVTAADTSANESAPAVAPAVTIDLGTALPSGRHENDADAITYSGTWVTNAHSQDSGGTSVTARSALAFARVGFEGNRVQLFARTGSYYGIANVYIDDVKVGTVDLYSSSSAYRRAVFTSALLPDGVHKLRIERAGTRNAKSSGNDIVVDSILVTDGVAPAEPATATAEITGVTVDVTWPASASSDVDGYRVYRRTGSDAAVQVADVASTATAFHDDMVPLDQPVTYTVTARDTSGNESAPVTAPVVTIAGGAILPSGRHENTAKDITYSGTWAENSHSSDSAGSSASGKYAGDFARAVFTQTGIEWIGRTGPAFGIAEVYLDGALVATVDTYSATQRFQQSLYRVDSLPEGRHTLRIVRTGTRSAASRGNDVVLDTLVVLDRVAPAAVSGQTATPRGLDVDTAWLGSPEPDVEGYRVYRSDDGAPAVRVAELGAADRAFADPAAPVGVPVSYTVTAFDSSGNESVPSATGPVTVSAAQAVRSGRWENTSEAISYTGTWATNSHSSDNSGSSAAAKASGDYAQIAFDGSGVEWISRTGPYLGVADVYLDDAKVATVDLYSPTQEFQKTSFSAQTPSEGVHKLRIVRTGTRNPASTGNDIVLDTLVVLDTRPPAALASATATAIVSTITVGWSASAARDLDGYRVSRSDNGAPPVTVATLAKSETAYSDPTAPIGASVVYTVSAVDTSGNVSVPTAAPAVTIDEGSVLSSSRYENTVDAVALSGSWSLNSHTSDSGGSSSAAKIAGDYGQIAFRESGVQWISRTGPSLGIAEVYLDDALVATVDLYTPTQLFQQTVFQRDGLAEGTHKLRVVRTGTRNAESSGNDIVIDSLVVTDVTAPATPADFATSVERGGIGLTWTPSTSADTVGYRVYRAFGTGPLADISGAAGLETTAHFLDVGLDLGASYRFAVAAVDSSGNESALSSVLTQIQPNHTPVATRYANCPAGGTTVGTLTALRSAIAAAKPGTVIKLLPGTYPGNVTVTASGTADAPIWICGPRTAVLDYSNVNSKNGVLLSGVSHVNIAGFTIQNFRKGVVVTESDHVSVADLMVRNIGEEAIKVRYNTTDSMIAHNTIQNTGRVIAMYGEGVYVGTSPKNWCEVWNCNEDNSDRNSIIGNNISGTTADPIELKPGVTGGIVRNNRVDGASTEAGTPLIAVKGNDVVITDNVGTNGKWSRGIWAAETEVKGYGYNNILARNTMGVPAGGTAFYVGLNAGNIVDDSNVALVTGSTLSNATLQK